jgi:hypothetical protein
MRSLLIKINKIDFLVDPIFDFDIINIRNNS